MRLPAVSLVLAALLACVASACAAEGPEPLPRAHAHNDYRHQRPLLEALAHGFCSVEADVFLVGDRLLVAHGWHELDPEKRLTTLYLDPLLKRVEANGGRVYRHGPPFTLLIDVKSDAQSTYARLHRVLADYAAMLTVVDNGNARPGAVTVVISGNRAAETLRKQRVRYAGLDGRLGDLESDVPDHLMPLISDRWSSHFRWRGRGPISPAERQKLRAIVAKAHAQGRRVRFWATPEREAVWRELAAAGVDLINTDDLAGLRRFLLSSR
jgi:glycerophosphoryl diester phosphodiesterase